METRIYHGKFTPAVVAQNLVAHFSRGNLIVQQIGDGANLAVQIASRDRASGGQTALSADTPLESARPTHERGSGTLLSIAPVLRERTLRGMATRGASLPLTVATLPLRAACR